MSLTLTGGKQPDHITDMTDEPYCQGPVLLCGHPRLGPGHVHGDVPAEGPPAGSWQGQQGGGEAFPTPARVLSQVLEQFYSHEDGSGDSTVNLSTLSLFSGNEGLNIKSLSDSYCQARSPVAP